MKTILSQETLPIPEGVQVDIKSRIVTVTGPRGVLKEDLSHIDVAFEAKTENEQTFLLINIHHGKRKEIARLRTVRSLIENLIIGVTKGFLYKMRYVYAHFPINVNLAKDANTGLNKIEIRNFLGQKTLFSIQVREGVTAEISTTQKDELILSGNSIADVSQNAADVQQACKVRNKDMRKFLDGIYVSERTNIVQD